MISAEMTDAMKEIIDACEGYVPPLTLLKGISICDQYYPKPHLRLMRDIDFLVEDNAGDVRLTREAFADARVPNRLHVVHDGIAALQFLRKEKPYAEAPDPDLV